MLLLGVLTLISSPVELPAKVDLEPAYRKLGLAPRAQGTRDTCSSFAITAVAEYEYRRAYPNDPWPLSEEFLVWAANEATGLRGDQAMFYEALHGLNELGICRTGLLPYREKMDASTKPGKRILADAKELSNRWKVNWIKRWNLNRTLTESEIIAIKIALANGRPIVMGLRWPKQLKGSALLDVSPPADVFDGHSIVLTGYEDDPKKKGSGVFFFRNSFGAGWGRNGYGTMSYAYVTAYANDALWLECGAPDSELPTERFEGETLVVSAHDKCPVVRQKMGNLWSGSEHLFCQASNGGSVQFEFMCRKAGKYRVRLLATAAPDFGTIRVKIDGKDAGTDFDLYAGRVCPSGSLELGEHPLVAGKHALSISVVGRSPVSKNHYFGLDTLDLIAVTPSSRR